MKLKNQDGGRLKAIIIASVSAAIVLFVGIWLISAAISSVNNTNKVSNETSNGTASVSDTTSGRDPKTVTGGDGANVEQTTDSNSNSSSSSNSSSTSSTSSTTPASVPKTGPSDIFFTAILAGIATYLVFLNIELVKRQKSEAVVKNSR